MPFLLAEILNFQGSTHRIGVGSFSKQLLSESQKPWNMTQSPLYYRYEDTAQGKAFSGIGKNFVRELYSEIENK